MDITDPKVEAYLLALKPTVDPVQREMEQLGKERRFPIVGPLVGRVLEELARSIGARRVFELGSGFGYSTLFFARAVGEGGEVVHTEMSAERSTEARAHLERAGLVHRVRFELGNALDVLARDEHSGPFDVVFIDLEKVDYCAAFELARTRVRPGGYILTDNVLWRGLVTGDPEHFDEATRAIDAYNRTTAAAPDFFTTILPIRDGVAMHLRLR